jgi:hypothetical protein
MFTLKEQRRIAPKELFILQRMKFKILLITAESILLCCVHRWL